MSDPAAKPRSMIDLDEFERRLRRPPSATRPEGDPLVELARLVGGQQDPFDSVFNQHLAARPAVEPVPPQFGDSWASPQPAAPRMPIAAAHPLSGNFAAIEAGLRGSIAPDFGDFSADGRAPSLTTEHAGHLHGAEWDDVDDTFAAIPATAAPEPPRSRRPLYVTAGIIVVGLCGIGASFALKGPSVGAREIAVIKAATSPTKVQADQNAADKSDASTSVLDKGAQQTPVAVVDRAEQPVDLSQTDQNGRPLKVVTLGTPQQAPGAASVPVPTPPAQYPVGVVAPPGMNELIEGKKVKTISVRPDGSLYPSEAAPQPVDPSATARLTPPTAPTPAAKASTPKMPVRVVTTPRTVVASNDDPTKATEDRSDSNAVQNAPPAHTRPQRVAAKEQPDATDPATATDKGGFAVQLAAPPTEEQAREALTRLVKQYGTILGGHHLGYHRASVGEKSVFRVRVGGLTREEATALCEKLKAAGGTCFSAKN